ncbi:hypothetical protein M406DRAFT_323387 [Cryphonectria parasitica EP155]|uniref:Uncharacterized protein n=1 Tax=Cryphonectria parasitica (strain ATCC 38755 / EP155) TaxID=660469 RepID=A0A9P4Y0K4_CRYP1|nr:uncharacterized protein M406DRAFT_323387 [Cryphonectria parasitica EP155]KAF3763935.1 hypothetical protein M406DRAFT_323387 [Cryphonectria parasitica EP155]
MPWMISQCFDQGLLQDLHGEVVDDHNGVPPIRLNVPSSFWDGNGSMLLSRKKSWPSNSKHEQVWRYKSAGPGLKNEPAEWNNLEEVAPWSKTWTDSHGLTIMPVVFEMKASFIHGLICMQFVLHDETIQLMRHLERLYWALGVQDYTQLEDLLKYEKEISEVVPEFSRTRNYYGAFMMDGQEYLVDIC